MCETPPVMNRKITRFALALKCGAFGASGFSGSAASSSERIPGSSRPPAARDRMACLRIMSVHEKERVTAEHRMDVTGPRLRVGLRVPGRTVLFLQPGKKLFRLLQFGGFRRTPEDGREGNLRSGQPP